MSGWRYRAGRTPPPCRGPEGRQHGVDVVGGGGFVAGHRDVVSVDQPDVDAARLGAVTHLGGPTGHPGQHGVEERAVHHVDTGGRQARSQRARVAVHPTRDPGQPIGAVVAGVHRGDHRQQHLRGADIAGGLVPADVLLAGLQRQPVGRGAVGIQRHPDQPAG